MESEEDEAVDEDEESNEESSDEEDEEEEEMEDGDGEEDDMTVYLKAAKAGIQCRKDSKCDPKPDQINEFNLHSNKDREKIFKKKQKERRKQAASSLEAMEDSDEDYNFETDFS